MANITINPPKSYSVFISQDGDVERFKHLLKMKVGLKLLEDYYEMNTIQGGELGTEFEIVMRGGHSNTTYQDIEKIVNEFLEAAE